MLFIYLSYLDYGCSINVKNFKIYYLTLPCLIHGLSPLHVHVDFSIMCAVFTPSSASLEEKKNAFQHMLFYVLPLSSNVLFVDKITC